MNKVVCVVLGLLAVAAAARLVKLPAADVARSMFEDFKADFEKTYETPAQEMIAFNNFISSLERIVKKNNNPEDQATYGLTKFSDLSEQEFAHKFLMSAHKPDYTKGKVGVIESLASPPDSFDWRNTSGVVTPVKNQEQCGSCWAFSTAENIESIWALAGNTLTTLSVQQIVSCDTTDDGCGGGEPPSAFEYIVNAGGLESCDAYPYTSGGGNSGTCKFQKSDIVAKITGYQWATQTRDESAMQSALYSWGPLSICVDARTWQDYTSGVITSIFCGHTLDHCVQATGYDTSANPPYWIVRNSWGTDWGLEGYLYVEYGKDRCGIAQEVTSATL